MDATQNKEIIFDVENAANWQQGTKVSLYFSPKNLHVYSFSTVGNNGQPMDAFHGIDLRLGDFDQCVREEPLIKAVQAFQSQLIKVAEGHSSEWDGSNLRGQLTEEAGDLLEEVRDSLAQESFPCEIDDVEAWLSPISREVAQDVVENGLEEAYCNTDFTEDGYQVCGKDRAMKALRWCVEYHGEDWDEDDEPDEEDLDYLCWAWLQANPE